MLLENKELENTVWEKVFKQFGFKPDCTVRTHNFSVSMPFDINVAFSVYGIEKMSDSQIEGMDDIIRKIFIEATKENERIYALDWEHSSFLYDPRNPDEQKSVWVDDARYFGGGFCAEFPAFYPDADYYFFIDENFRFGYLGHPWRQEVWVFGELLVHKFDQIYNKLGWIKLK